MPLSDEVDSGDRWLTCTWRWKLSGVSRGRELQDAAESAEWLLLLDGGLRFQLTNRGAERVEMVLTLIEDDSESPSPPKYRLGQGTLTVEAVLLAEATTPRGSEFTFWAMPQMRDLLDRWLGHRPSGRPLQPVSGTASDAQPKSVADGGWPNEAMRRYLTSSGDPWLTCALGMSLDDIARNVVLTMPGVKVGAELQVDLDLRDRLAQHGVEEVYLMVTLVDNPDWPELTTPPKYRLRKGKLTVEAYLVDDPTRPRGEDFTTWAVAHLGELLDDWITERPPGKRTRKPQQPAANSRSDQ